MKRSVLDTAIDAALVPFVYLSSRLLRRVRGAGLQRLSLCRRVLMNVGAMPLLNHYYEPQFDYRYAMRPLSDDRCLPGIDWNVEGQLQVLEQMRFADELAGVPRTPTGHGNELEFFLENNAFESGDAEYWYQFIRLMRPARIFEIGSGNSTLMAIKAIRRLEEEQPEYRCRHVCIEPYEMPWLERSGVEVIRKKVEDVELPFFAELEANDILFIDSSHVIRPQGDVLFEFLEILPTLRDGVYVHVHDIFSPKNYPRQWLVDDVKFWNEQYLLEAFLSQNPHWRIVGALNYLKHKHYEQLKAVAPFLTPEREPGSFYMRKVS